MMWVKQDSLFTRPRNCSGKVAVNKAGVALTKPRHPMKCAASANIPTFVSSEWLISRLNDPNIQVLSCPWYLPTMGRNGSEEFKAQRIPGSGFFEIDGVCDPNTDLPHMLPSEAEFAAAADALGISNNTHVVLYDHLGLLSTPRVWWTFRVLGHDKVSILQGGLPAWVAAGHKTEPATDADLVVGSSALKSNSTSTQYVAKLDRSKVRTLQDMLDNMTSRAEQVVDARSQGRFVGTEPEPRPGLKGGHIPGSKNLPFPKVLDNMSVFKSMDEVCALFKEAGVQLDGRPLVGTCGSGLTACVLALAVYELTGNLVPIYDGSWSEWGAKDNLPVSTDME